MADDDTPGGATGNGASAEDIEMVVSMPDGLWCHAPMNYVWTLHTGEHKKTKHLCIGDRVEEDEGSGNWQPVLAVGMLEVVDGENFFTEMSLEELEAMVAERPLTEASSDESAARSEDGWTRSLQVEKLMETLSLPVAPALRSPEISIASTNSAPEIAIASTESEPETPPSSEEVSAIPPDSEESRETESEVSPAFARDSEMAAEDLLGYVRNVGPAAQADDVYAVLARCLAAEVLDPILMKIHYRSQSRDLVLRLAKMTELLTSVAQSFGLDLDGKPVESDRDFSRWGVDKLRRLATVVWSHVESTKHVREEMAVVKKLLAEERAARKAVEEKLASQAASAVALAQVGEESLEAVRASIRYANSLLAEFKEQPMFVVA